MECINCGKTSNSFICKRCEQASKATEAALRQGISVEYNDGSKKNYEWPKK